MPTVQQEKKLRCCKCTLFKRKQTSINCLLLKIVVQKSEENIFVSLFFLFLHSFTLDLIKRIHGGLLVYISWFLFQTTTSQNSNNNHPLATKRWNTQVSHSVYKMFGSAIEMCVCCFSYFLSFSVLSFKIHSFSVRARVMQF